MLRKLLIGLVVVIGFLLLVGLRPDLSAADVDARFQTGSSRFATLADGTRVHFWDRGDARSPVLVLLHGSYDCANTWELWAPLLERDFRLIVPDLPAHGLTGTTTAGDYSIQGMATALHGLLESLGIERASIAGNSMGGNTAWRFALEHPQSVERLVLLDASGFPRDNAPEPPSQNGLIKLLYRYGNPTPLIRAGFAEAVEDKSLITDDRVERWVSYIRRERSRDAHRKRAELRGMNDQPHERLRELRVKTLIVWGEKDALIPVEHAALFDAAIPDSRAIVYAGIGHMPQLEAPERSAKDVREFLLAP